jgi:thioredoxin reductase (NADPH)
MEKLNTDVLIVGSGPAGMTAAIYAARAGLKTTILEKLGAGGQVMLTQDIENFPAFQKITGAELSMQMAEQVESLGVETIYDELISLDTKAMTATTHEYEIATKAVILATGARSRQIGAIGEEKFTGAGVHYCALCDGAFYRDKDVVVVGGGNSAVEEVLYLADIVRSVTVINAFPSFTAQQISIDKLNTIEKVKGIYHNATVTKITGDKKVASVEFVVDGDSPQTIEVSGVFIAIGRVPNTDMLNGVVDLSKDGYIVADSKLMTSAAGIFAAGDVIEKHIRQIITACSDGAIAATFAAEYIKNKM